MYTKIQKVLDKAFFAFAFIILSPVFFAQEIDTKKPITIENIFRGKYYPVSLDGFTTIPNTSNYLVKKEDGLHILSFEDSSIDRVWYKGNFEDYVLGPDPEKGGLLLISDVESIYRHSFRAVYTYVNPKTGISKSIFGGKKIQEATFSPDGKWVAFVFDNNMFCQNLETDKIQQITLDGKKNTIINGLADWVYEEEFGHARYFEWAPDSSALLFVKFDESAVKEMKMQIYSKNLYPENEVFKYPKAGEDNSKVSLNLYSLINNSSKAINLAAFKNYYIPLIKPGAKAQEFFVLTSERKQNAVDVITIKNDVPTKLFTETDAAWIDTDKFDLDVLPNGNFIWSSEKSGFRHLYLVQANGKSIKPITSGSWEVTEYYGKSPDNQYVYFQSTLTGSTKKVVAKSEIKSGKTSVISTADGTATANFSGDFAYFVEKYATPSEPGIFSIKKNNGELLRVLVDNIETKKRLAEDSYQKKEFINITINADIKLNAWIIKPQNFNPQKKYPVLMYQYSGPGSQQVEEDYDPVNTMWFNMLAQNGYIVVCADGRGTGFRGRDFKKATYLNLGNLEIEDQISVANWLGKQNYVDASRIGIFGWSFGGYMTSLAMTKGNGIFKAGIAVAPVTNWKFYDSVYTERFLDTPQNNPKGYSENSPTEFAKNLKGNLLLIHGTADDNVHFQNSMEFAEALIQNNKQFQMMVYPDKNHGIYGGYTRIQLYTLMTNFILKNL